MEKDNEISCLGCCISRQWTMYVAGTTEGLGYVGLQHGAFEELGYWVKKRTAYFMVFGK